MVKSDVFGGGMNAIHDVQNLPQEPPSVATPEWTDSLLVKTMNQLSMNEKEEAFADLHGVSDLATEAPDFVNRKLSDLDMMISKLNSKNSAYDMALSMSPSYVTSRKLRLQFLRKFCFRVEPAARRFLDFFEVKLELFGAEKLTKTIEQSDLDEDDMKCLKSGWTQLRPEKDSAGRAIITCVPLRASYFSKTCTPENKLRSIFYVYMSAAEDEEIQKRGYVFLACENENFESERSTTWRASRLGKIMPLRCAAAHFCFNDARMKWLMALVVAVADPRTRARIRHHSAFGQVEYIYNLMTFGIPSEAFPLSENGEIKPPTNLELMKKRQLQTESQMGPKENMEKTGVLPSEKDILLGRGRNFRNHPGNVRFHRIIEMHEAQYENSSRYGKQLLSDAMLNLVKQDGARFLKKKSGIGWLEVSDEDSRERVCHAFRNRRLVSAKSMDSGTSKESVASILSARMNVETDAPYSCFGFNIGICK